MRLHLVRGVGLRAADRNGKSDPYVVASTGKQKKKSHVVKRTLDPEWDEVLEFEGALRDFLSRPLLLKVYDWDQMSFNDLLGEVSVSLDELRISDSHSYRVRLPTQGRLEFRVKWSPPQHDSHTEQAPPTPQRDDSRRRRLFGASSTQGVAAAEPKRRAHAPTAQSSSMTIQAIFRGRKTRCSIFHSCLTHMSPLPRLISPMWDVSPRGRSAEPT